MRSGRSVTPHGSGGLFPSLRNQKKLSRVWIFHDGPGRKTGDIDILSLLRYIRTRDHAFPARDRNSIGQTSFCFFISAADTPRTVPVNFSSLEGCDECATAGGVAVAAGAARELGRRVACGVLVG